MAVWVDLTDKVHRTLLDKARDLARAGASRRGLGDLAS